MKPRIIVCGLGSTGYKIFSLLKQQGAFVTGINDQYIPDPEHNIVIGDLKAASTLISAGINEAHTLVIAGNNETLNLAILTQARVLNPQIRIINRLFNTSLGDRLDKILPEHFTMSEAALAAPVFAFTALGNRAIGQLRLFNQTWPIHEEYIHEQHPWKGRKLSDLWDERSRMLIYYLPIQEQIDLVSAVIYGQQLAVGDRLIVGTQPSVRNQRQSYLNKVWKILTNLQWLQEHLQPLALVTIALVLTILIASFTYIFFDFDTSIADAIYFSVGMITGAGGNDKVAENAPNSIKIFTVLMMLLGAAIIGIFYALLNDFVLGTRLKQFWDAARVPQRNHFIICGLGGVGVQIVNQLHSHGHEVVVIESDPNNRFLNTVRALGIPIIQGDASLSATLAAANINQAEALLAVTSNDIANLEIALSTKGLVSKLPVIVRVQDSEFAFTIKKVFQFEAVLSPTELAAPAFAAAALGGRILGNGLTAESLWIALGTFITSEHPFCGKRVKDAAMDADFVPLYVETKLQTIHGWDVLETCLTIGDVLYLTIPATRLDQLWRVNTSPINALHPIDRQAIAD